MTPRSSHFLSLWKLASSIIPSCLRLQLRLINSLLQSEANLSKRNWPLTCSFLVFWPLFHLAASKSQSSWKHYVHFLLFHWTSLLPTPASLPVSLRLPRPSRLHSQRMPVTSWWSGFFLNPTWHSSLYHMWAQAWWKFSSPCISLLWMILFFWWLLLFLPH